jgi:hypothetical protein
MLGRAGDRSDRVTDWLTRPTRPLHFWMRKCRALSEPIPSSALGVTIFALLVLAPIATAVYLARRAA